MEETKAVGHLQAMQRAALVDDDVTAYDAAAQALASAFRSPDQQRVRVESIPSDLSTLYGHHGGFGSCWTLYAPLRTPGLPEWCAAWTLCRSAYVGGETVERISISERVR